MTPANLTCGVCGAQLDERGPHHCGCAPALLKRIEALEAWRAEVTAGLEAVAAFATEHHERTQRIVELASRPTPAERGITTTSPPIDVSEYSTILCGTCGHPALEHRFAGCSVRLEDGTRCPCVSL